MSDEKEPVKAKVSGTGVVRDKDGNIKGTFSFTGEGAGTLDQLKQIFGAEVANGGKSSDGNS